MMLGLIGGLVAAFMFLFGSLIGLACFALWIWMLVDCLTNSGIQGSEKVAWVLVIIFLPFIGSLIYPFIGRPKRRTA
jgi:hypothetical protein